MARPEIIYKLPDAFKAKHRQLLEAWDWDAHPVLALAEVLPDEPDLAGIKLERVPARGLVRSASANDTVVRIARTSDGAPIGSAHLAMRRYADALPSETESQ